MAALPPLHNLRLGDDIGRSIELNKKIYVENGEGKSALTHKADTLENNPLQSFEQKSVILSRLTSLIKDLKTDYDVVDSWRASLCKNLNRKSAMYETQINGFLGEVKGELQRLLRIYHAARQDVSKIEREEPTKDNTKDAGDALVKKSDTQPIDVVDSGRWELLIAKIASLKTLLKKIRERELIVFEEASWRLTVANFVNVLSRLNDYPDQTGLIDKMVDLIRAFIKNPAIASNQFYNIIIMGVAGTGKTRLAGILGSIMAQLGLYVYDELVEANVGDFIAGYVGQTENKVSKFLSNNAEKVVFLDEAYALTQWNEDHTYLEGYSPQAVAELIAYLSKNVGKIAFIAAGYEDKMTYDFLPANEGLDRRFPIKATLGDYGVETLFKIFVRALALTFMEPEPTEREEKRDWEARLADKTTQCTNLFDQHAILMLYDVINASRDKVKLRAAPPKTKDDARPCDGDEQDLCAAVASMQDLVATLVAQDTKKPEKVYPFDAFRYPRLARFFSAQAGAMTNLAGIASTLLIAHKDYKDETSLDILSVDRNGMFQILLTMIETTFTGEDKAPPRTAWTEEGMNARDAAHAELLYVLKFASKYTEGGQQKVTKWIVQEKGMGPTWAPIDAMRKFTPSPASKPPMMPVDVPVKKESSMQCQPPTPAEQQSGTAIPQTQEVVVRDEAMRDLERALEKSNEDHDATKRILAAMDREVQELRILAQAKAAAAAASGSSATPKRTREAGGPSDPDNGEEFAYSDPNFAGGAPTWFRFYKEPGKDFDKDLLPQEIDNMKARYIEGRDSETGGERTWMNRLQNAKNAWVDEKRRGQSGRDQRRRRGA